MIDVSEFTNFMLTYLGGNEVQKWKNEICEKHVEKTIAITRAFAESGAVFDPNMNINADYDSIIRTDDGIIIFVGDFSLVVTNICVISIEKPFEDRRKYLENYPDEDSDGIMRSWEYSQAKWDDTFIVNDVGEMLLRNHTSVIIDMIRSKLLPEAIALIIRVLNRERGGQ